MKNATLCFLVRGPEVLLGFKKRGFGMGKYNGFGGKVNHGEGIEAAAVRELQEETGITVASNNLERKAELDFYFPQRPEWNQRVYVFVVREWEGTPQESEEMSPEWFSIPAIPYGSMWVDDQYWLPRILNGEKLKGSFTFGEEGNILANYHLQENP